MGQLHDQIADLKRKYAGQQERFHEIQRELHYSEANDANMGPRKEWWIVFNDKGKWADFYTRYREFRWTAYSINFDTYYCHLREEDLKTLVRFVLENDLEISQGPNDDSNNNNSLVSFEAKIGVRGDHDCQLFAKLEAELRKQIYNCPIETRWTEEPSYEIKVHLFRDPAGHAPGRLVDPTMARHLPVLLKEYQATNQ